MKAFYVRSSVLFFVLGGALLVLLGGASTAHAAVPTLTTVSIASNGAASTSYATTGNTVTLTFVGSETIGSVSVAFTSGGVAVAGAVTLASTSQSAFTAAYTVNAADTDGTVGFTINFTGHDTQTPGVAKTAVIGLTHVIVDRVTPTFSSIIGFPTITSTTSTVTVNWTSSEAASESWIEYGLTTALGTHASESATHGLSAHTVSVTGLTQCTLYYYKVHSQDYILLEGTGVQGSLTTAGCGTIAHPSATPTPTPTPAASATPTPTPTPAASVTPTPTPTLPVSTASPSQYNLHEGDVVGASTANDPDIYIINTFGYKRLFLNPIIFNFYGHLSGWSVVKPIAPVVRDAFVTSGLFRNCETGDQKVYALESTGEDTGVLHHVNLTGDQALSQDPNFFKKVFCINSNEFNWYTLSAPFSSFLQVPTYQR